MLCVAAWVWFCLATEFVDPERETHEEQTNRKKKKGFSLQQCFALLAQRGQLLVPRAYLFLQIFELDLYSRENLGVNPRYICTHIYVHR